MGREQPPEVAARHAEAGGQVVLGVTIQRAVEYELHGSAHELGPVPTKGWRGAIRATQQAGPEPCRFGRGRGLVRAHVAGMGPAPHPGRQ